MPDPVVLLKKDHREAEAMLKTLAASKPGTGGGRPSTSSMPRSGSTWRSKSAPCTRWSANSSVRTMPRKRTSSTPSRDGLVKLHQLVDRPGFGAAVAMVTAGIKHHVKEEEHEMFPDLKKKLDRADLMALGAEVEAEKKQARKRQRSAA